MEPTPGGGPADAESDLRIAEILEELQMCRGNGETPDLLELAGGDAALAEQARQLADVVGAIHSSGFASLDAQPLTAALAKDELPCVPGFEIIQELGRGGMGVVYEARQISLDRVVALKLLPLGTVDRAAAERFAREAATAAGLRHPNIVPIYATGEAPGTLWYAMPKIEGQSLAQLIAKHPAGLAWQRVVEIGIVAAEALVYAHRQGIVHRDVKPANFLEDAGGHVWLTDFGVARRDADAAATLSQAICGTPRYMSPEQIAGGDEPIDHRTDLYSLGATLYELATGRAVVASTSPLEVLQEVRHGEPIAPRVVNPRLPRALEVVLLKCLEKSPRDRYAMAADLLADLQALADGRPIAARGLPLWTVWQRRLARNAGRVRLAALAATAAIVVVGAAMLSYQYYAARHQAQVQISSAGDTHEAALRRAPVVGQSDEDVTSLALPMRQPLTLEAGDYEIAFASPGRFGERARLQLDAGDVATPRYIDRRPPPPAVNIDGMWVSEIQSAEKSGEVYLGTMSDRQLAVYAEGGRECFRLDVGVEPSSVGRAAGPSGAEDGSASRPTITVPSLHQLKTTAELFKHVDFSYQTDAPFTGKRLARRPYLARPERFMPNTIDLNQDGAADFVIAARLEPIVAALDHRGNLLWASRVEVSVPSDASPPWIGGNKVQPPGILQMLPARDFTGDGICDLLVVSVSIRLTPAAPPGCTYSQVALLSGGNGNLVWTTALPAIAVANGSRWPLDGLLEYEPLPQYRAARPLQVGNPSDAARFSPLVEDRRVKWNDRPRANVPVTPPISLLDDGEHALVVTSAREVRKLELGSGQLGKAIVLAPSTSVLAMAPRAVRRGVEREPGILAHYLDDNSYGMSVGEKLALYASESPTPLWGKPLVVDTNLGDSGFERTDFPFLADLDHDGTDVVLVAEGEYLQPKRIRCRDAETGDDRWPLPARIRCAEASPERICLAGDLDADGVDDLAIASLYGEAKHDSEAAIHTQRVGVSIYVDVVSGRDGRRLSVVRHEIGEVDTFTQVVEIDALRRTAPGEVEVSLVWGEARERSLDSLSVRFSLTRDELPLFAPGLTALTGPSPSGGGFYLRRPGPDELGGETAVWIGPESGGLLVAGYQRVLAHWQNAQGTPRVLLQDRAMTRLAAVEVPSGRVLWRQSTAGTVALARYAQRSNRHCILTQIFYPTTSACQLTCLDAESGRAVATFKFGFDRMYDAALCADDSNDVFLLTGPAGEIQIAKNLAGFRLQRIALDGHRIVWKRDLLSRASANYVQRFPKTLLADVDGDGVADCVMPDDSAGNALRLVAISGRDGRELWSCATGMTSDKWPSGLPGNDAWPLMELVLGHDGASQLVLLDKRSSDQILVRLLQLADGRELDSKAYAGQAERLGHLANRAGLSMRVEGSGDAEPTVSLVVPEFDDKGRLAIECSRLQVRDNRFHETGSAVYETGGRDVQMQIVSADAVTGLDRIVLTADSPTSYSLARYGGHDGAVLWRRTLAADAGHPLLVATDDAKYMILRSDQSALLLDIATGQDVCRVGHIPSEWPEVAIGGPTLLMHDSTPYLVHQQRDGVRISSPIDMAGRPKLSAATSSKPRYDPRQWRNPEGSPLSVADRTLGDLVVNWIRAGLQSLLAFIIPLAGINWLIQKRRFSLAQLSLAPLAALACLMAWKTMLTEVAPVGRAGQEPWFIVLFSGTMVVVAAAFVVRCVARRKVGLLAGMLTLAVVFTAVVQFLPALLAADDVHYRSGWDHFLAGVLAVLIGVLPPALVVWSIASAIKRRLARRGA